MVHSFQFFPLPIDKIHRDTLVAGKSRDFGGAVITILKPRKAVNHYVAGKKGKTGKYMHAMIFISGVGGIGVMADKITEENWQIRYNQIRRNLGKA